MALLPFFTSAVSALGGGGGGGGGGLDSNTSGGSPVSNRVNTGAKVFGGASGNPNAQLVLGNDGSFSFKTDPIGAITSNLVPIVLLVTGAILLSKFAGGKKGRK